MRKFSLIFFVFLLLVLPSFSANKKVIEKQLESLSKTLEQTKVNYEKIRQQYQDLMVQIKNTDKRIGYLEKKIDSTKKSLNVLNKKIGDLNNEIGKVSAKLVVQKRLLQKELKGYYKYSFISRFYNKGVWFSYMNGYVAGYMQSRIENYINQRGYLKRRIEQLNKYKLMKQGIIKDIKNQQAALNKQKSQLKTLALQATEKKTQYLNRIQEITKQQKSLKELLKKIIKEEEEKRKKELLARKRKRRKNITKINPKLVAREFSALARKIPPPVSGKVVGYFGRKYDPLFRVYTRNDGIDIKVKKGSCVKSIAYGKIDFVGNLPGYGGVVIINHLNGYYTVYGGVMCLYKVGNIVKAYQCIGKMTSDKLHFEIRRHATPLNPLNYLDRRLLK